MFNLFGVNGSVNEGLASSCISFSIVKLENPTSSRDSRALAQDSTSAAVNTPCPNIDKTRRRSSGIRTIKSESLSQGNFARFAIASATGKETPTSALRAVVRLMGAKNNLVFQEAFGWTSLRHRIKLEGGTERRLSLQPGRSAEIRPGDCQRPLCGNQIDKTYFSFGSKAVPRRQPLPRHQLVMLVAQVPAKQTLQLHGPAVFALAGRELVRGVG